MSASRGRDKPQEGASDELVLQLMNEMGRAFDLSKGVGAQTLGEAVEQRVRALKVTGAPGWGTDGTLTQLAKTQSGALDFYYRPHLFPEMDPVLRLGHHLQFDLLPRRLPAESPLHIAAVLESYCHLSGDLLGWRMEGEELFLWIADVSGHGVRAGLAAATLYFLIDSIERGLPLAEFARRASEGMLSARNLDDQRALFATAIWLRARRDGRICYASSGPNPMLLLRSSGEFEELDSTGLPLAMLPGQTFEMREFELGPEDALCLFTDGVTEATNPDDEEFGIARLAQLWNGPSETILDLTRRIYGAVREHQATGLLEDDLTFMLAERSTLGR